MVTSADAQMLGIREHLGEVLETDVLAALVRHAEPDVGDDRKEDEQQEKDLAPAA